MTVATEAAYAERSYTGVETQLSPGFSAENVSDVLVSYLDTEGLPVALTQGVHFSVALGADDAVTVNRIAFPSASAGSPVTMIIQRATPALQAVDFENLNAFDPEVYETLFDRAFRILGELKGAIARAMQPFATTNSFVDFRPRTVRAAEPTNPADLATKAYADLVSGTDAAGEASAAAAAAAASETACAADKVACDADAASCATYAAILGNPDYGFYTDVVTSSRDYGTYV